MIKDFSLHVFINLMEIPSGAAADMFERR